MRSLQSHAAYALISALLSGCGAMVVYPSENTNGNPTTGHTATREFWIHSTKKFLPEGKQDKSGFMADWGSPDEIVKTNESGEEWVYQKKLWCGVVPVVYFLPVPLVLPVCNGFDRVEFEGDRAIFLKSRRSKMAGCVFPLACGA